MTPLNVQESLFCNLLAHWMILMPYLNFNLNSYDSTTVLCTKSYTTLGWPVLPVANSLKGQKSFFTSSLPETICRQILLLLHHYPRPHYALTSTKSRFFLTSDCMHCISSVFSFCNNYTWGPLAPGPKPRGGQQWMKNTFAGQAVNNNFNSACR